MDHESTEEYRSDNSNPHEDSQSSEKSGQPLPQPPQPQQVQLSNQPPPYTQPQQVQFSNQPPPYAQPQQGQFSNQPPPYAQPQQGQFSNQPPPYAQPQQGQYQPAPVNSYANTPNNGQPGPAPGHNIQYIYPPNVPQPPIYYHVGSEPWTTDLFDCMDDPNSALITMFLPCVTVGQVAEIVDSGTTTCTTAALIYGAIACLTGLQYAYSCGFRTKLRRMYNLVESPGPDILVHCLCGCCAISQEFRELRNRGLDPALGWNGVLAARQQLQQGVVGMAAPPPQMMAMR